MQVGWGRSQGQLVCSVREGEELTGCVVIDSLVRGRACGGLRMVPHIDETKMRRLASNMTLKYGFLGMPRGGAKAAVRGDPEGPESDRFQLLADFGRAIAPLLRQRIFSPGADSGTEPAGIRHMLESVGMSAQRRWSEAVPPGYYPALTVLTGIQRAARHRGLGLEGCTAAVQGWGKVGSALGSLLAQSGIPVVAISTSRGAIHNGQGLDVGELLRLAREHGSRVVEVYRHAERIDLESLLRLDVDVLCPCAISDAIHGGNAPAVQARMVVSGANNAVTPEADRVLFERGVLCLPDFMTNCGIILGSAMELAWIPTEQVSSFIAEHVGASITGLLDEAGRQQVPLREVAVPYAHRRFERMCQDAERTTMLGRLIEFGVALNRHGLVPGPVVAAASRQYFRRMVAQNW
jgi:glutamate dehydrogenase/leucine dehydrogenase